MTDSTAPPDPSPPISAGYRTIINRVAKNSFWLLFGSAISQGLMLLVMVYIGRKLGPANLGRFGMIQITVNLLASLAGVSLGLTSAKYVAEYRSTDRERAGRAIGLAALVALGAGAGFSAALALSAPLLARTTLHSPDMAGLLRIGAAWVLFIVLNAEQAGVLSGLEEFRTLATINTIRGCLMLIGGGAGVIAGGVAGAILGFSIASCLLCAITAIYVRAGCRRAGIRAIYFSREHEFGVITGFSLPKLSRQRSRFACYLDCIRHSGESIEWVSIHGPVQCRDPLAGSGMLSARGTGPVGLPVLANLLGTRDKRAYRRAFLSLLGGITLSAGIVAGVLCAAVSLLVRLYGAGYADAKPVFLIVIVTTVVSSIDWALALALSSMGRMWSLSCLTVIWALLVIGLALWWIPIYKTLGFAAAFLAAYVLEVCIRGWYVHRSLRIHFATMGSPVNLFSESGLWDLQQSLPAEQDLL